MSTTITARQKSAIFEGKYGEKGSPSAADRWHTPLYTITALCKLAKDVMYKHMESEHEKCRMDLEIVAGWEALRLAEEKVQQVIDELADENYRLVVNERVTV